METIAEKLRKSSEEKQEKEETIDAPAKSLK